LARDALAVLVNTVLYRRNGSQFALLRRQGKVSLTQQRGMDSGF